MSEVRVTADTGLSIIAKVDEERRLVLAWANVNTVAGRYVVDKQGDIIEDRELEEAVLDYSLNSRAAKAMHAGGKVAEGVVFPMTDLVQKALGIDLGRGGAIGLWRVTDDATWSDIKAGRLPALSLGGRAVREEAGNDYR
jgi:hypothetical protein